MANALSFCASSADSEELQVLAAIDGDPVSGFAARDEFITDTSKLGPLLDGEYYTLAPDIWGSDNSHNIAKDSDVARFVQDLDWVLGANNSISLYVRAMSIPRPVFTRTPQLISTRCSMEAQTLLWEAVLYGETRRVPSLQAMITAHPSTRVGGPQTTTSH